MYTAVTSNISKWHPEPGQRLVNWFGKLPSNGWIAEVVGAMRDNSTLSFLFYSSAREFSRVRLPESAVPEFVPGLDLFQ